jgi:hypothetical protein
MEEVNPSTKAVIRGESVGRTVEDADLIEAVRQNRLDVELNSQMWRKHMARRVEATTVVELIDPAIFVSKLPGQVSVGHNGHDKKTSLEVKAVEAS